MSLSSRRSFLTASLAGVAASAWAQGRRVYPEDPPFQPATIFLTWHRDPTTTMVVQWIGTQGETSDYRIFYRPVLTHGAVAQWTSSAGTPGGFGSLISSLTDWRIQMPVSKPYPKTDFKVFRAELTGLHPGTNYEFRLGKSSPMYRFRTMPRKATDGFMFVSGGDCGVNQHAVENNQQAARLSPQFVIIGGDLGYDNGRSVEVSLAFIRNYSKHMIDTEGRLIPLVPCIGNHEVDGGYGKPRTKAPFFFALFDGLFPETSYNTLDFGDYLSLVLLDTGHVSPIGGEQADWLEKTLKARKDHPNVLAVNHVPAYPSFRNPTSTVPGKAGTGEENRKYWVPLFDKYRVPVVLEHHDHTFKRTKPLLDHRADDNGVLYLGDGSWGRLRAAKSPDELSYLAKSSSDFHLSLHRLQGEERFHLAMDSQGRVMDVCRSAQRKTGIIRTTEG
ncbi:MAG: metallophosphoesterase family protein [Planctomycetia bacterium]|nr:metallophosphoesterase family protein [Planctomycetia bacterium]